MKNLKQSEVKSFNFFLQNQANTKQNYSNTIMLRFEVKNKKEAKINCPLPFYNKKNVI